MRETPTVVTTTRSVAEKPNQTRGYSAFIPVLLILTVLIFSTCRDMLDLHRHITVTQAENALAAERLKKAGQEAELVEKVRVSLFKLAETDPVAAQIKIDFFPTAPPSKGASSLPPATAPTPAPKNP